MAFIVHSNAQVDIADALMWYGEISDKVLDMFIVELMNICMMLKLIQQTIK